MGLAYQLTPIGDAVTPVKLSVEGRKRAVLLCEHVANMTAFFMAASLAGVPQPTASLWRARSPEFQQMLAAAEERRIQLLEAEAWRRAVGGSDTMLIFMLKAARPAALLVAMRHKQERAKEAGETVDAEYTEVADDPWA